MKSEEVSEELEVSAIEVAVVNPRSECLDTVNTLLPHMASAGIGKDDYLKLLMLAEDKYENMVDIDKLMRVALSLTGSAF